MRTEKVMRNITAGLLLQLTLIISGFILPRLYIQHYGSDINGMISSIKQFLMYLSLVEGGIAAAAISTLYKPILEKKYNEINRILSATKDFYKKLSLLFIFFLVLIAVLYAYIVSEEIKYTLSFFMVLVLGTSAFIEIFVMGKYRVVLTAYQKNFIFSRIQIQATILNTLLIIILIYFNMDILTIQLVATSIYVLRVLLVKKYIFKHHPEVKFNVDPNHDALKSKWSALIHQLSSLIVFNSPIILLTIFTSLSDVSVYAVYMIVFSGVQMMISSFSNGLVAAFGDVLANNDEKLLRKTFSEFEFVFYIVLFIIYTSTFLLIMPFISIYTTGITDVNYYNPLLGTLFVVVGIANNIRIPTNILVTSAGHFKETQKQALIEAVINITASIVLVINYGIIGVLLGGICSYMYRTLDFIFYTNKNILKQSTKSTFNKLGVNMALLFTSIFFINWIIDIKPNNLFMWLLFALIIVVISTIIILLGNALIFPNEFKNLCRRVSKILKR